MSHGLAVSGTYVYSKSIDDASSIGGGGGVVVQNPFDLPAERGLSSFDRRHTLNLTYTWSSPSRANRWLKDWTLQGIVALQSGTPLTARVLGNISDTGGTGSVGSGRASATGLPVVCCGQFFDLAAFTIPATGQFGNAGRNVIEGPGVFSINSSISRSISLSERRRLEFRLEANNVTNHVNYTSVSTAMYTVSGSANAGTGLLTFNNSFGAYNNANSNFIYNQRQIQLGARFNF
jgi:hypothetical protein